MQEVLLAQAAIANIASFALAAFQEYKQRRMEKDKKRG